MSSKNAILWEEDTVSYILIVEDDPEQMDLLCELALNEIERFSLDEYIDDEQRQKIKSIELLKVTNLAALQKTVSNYKEVLLVILDCNLPDREGSIAHDQFVKTNFRITGQHSAVDIVTKHLPETPITLVSTSNRFRGTVNRFYNNKYGLSLYFINKAERSTISRNIGHYLRRQFGSPMLSRECK